MSSKNVRGCEFYHGDTNFPCGQCMLPEDSKVFCGYCKQITSYSDKIIGLHKTGLCAWQITTSDMFVFLYNKSTKERLQIVRKFTLLPNDVRYIWDNRSFNPLLCGTIKDFEDIIRKLENKSEITTVTKKLQTISLN